MADFSTLKIAVVQMASGADKRENVIRAADLVRRSADSGATLVALPETFDYRGDAVDLKSVAEPLPGSALSPLISIAKERGVWVLAGSVHERDPEGGMPFNTSVLVSPDGSLVAAYRKIHLFDISIGDRSVTESAKYQSGNRVVYADAAGVRVGLTICFDLRFPELYRALADAGADVIFVPSSFTAPTGEAHWEVLVRARAIENQCFVVAPGQAGVGAGGIATYGNSMVVDPWGRVLARAHEEREYIITATLNLADIEGVRRRLPAWRNQKHVETR